MLTSFNSLSFDDSIPELVVNNTKYHGINILKKLNELKKMDLDANTKFVVDSYFTKASLYSTITNKIPELGFKLHSEEAVFPKKKIEDVGYDLTITKIHKKISDMTIMYDTEVSCQIPLGFYVQIHPRSSISKTGYILSNNTGIADPGYTGTIKVVLTKIDPSMPNLELPLRIAQLVVTPYINCLTKKVDNHLDTDRGSNGFGSSNNSLFFNCYSQ